MGGFEKFKEQLSTKEKFYSVLADKDKKYEHVLKAWKRFEMKPIRDYQDVYLKCDIFLLVDVFKKFRSGSLKNYGLCPSYYFTAPALSWDVMLNITKVELEHISDADMYLLFQKGIRGGVCYISKRYGKARNKYLKSYDPKQESKHFINLDANNLYGYAMSKFLPTGGFKWIS